MFSNDIIFKHMAAKAPFFARLSLYKWYRFLLKGLPMALYRGFTLIELMIVVAIIAFLSMISVPSLMKFLAKAKRAEAYMHLRALANAQKAHFAEFGSYTKNLGDRGLGWKPEGIVNYTYGFSDGAAGESHFIGHLKTPASALAGASIGRDSFTIYAAGHIYGEKPDILSIDQHNVIKIVSDALN